MILHQTLNIYISWSIDFTGKPTRLGIFYAYKFEKRDHVCTYLNFCVGRRFSLAYSPIPYE